LKSSDSFKVIVSENKLLELEKFLIVYFEINLSDLHSKEIQSINDTKLTEEDSKVKIAENCN